MISGTRSVADGHSHNVVGVYQGAGHELGKDLRGRRPAIVRDPRNEPPDVEHRAGQRIGGLEVTTTPDAEASTEPGALKVGCFKVAVGRCLDGSPKSNERISESSTALEGA